MQRDPAPWRRPVVEKTKAYAKAAKDRVYPEIRRNLPLLRHAWLQARVIEFYGCKGCKLRVYKITAGRTCPHG